MFLLYVCVESGITKVALAAPAHKGSPHIVIFRPSFVSGLSADSIGTHLVIHVVFTIWFAVIRVSSLAEFISVVTVILVLLEHISFFLN